MAGRALAREGAEAGGERLAKWWAVRAAGGTYQLLRRMPEAVGRLGVAELANLGRPLCAKAGLRLSVWRPLRFLAEKGPEVLRRVPPSSGLKYIGAQVLQAGVGLVAIHKMEEHLASRQPRPADE